ncbi:MAG: beta galactosidase jelly roll domain-containing protein [Asticcacaulis sp.]|nr:beta galactosidase jelly roll domain-containing protein [Asticcacaulis sp.]
MKLVRYLILVLACLWPAAVAAGERQMTDLDAGWRFLRGDMAGAEVPAFDDRAWQRVDLPHSFNAQDGAIMDYYRGPAWYRRQVTLAPKPGTRAYIEFDGAALTTEIWVNGVKAGRHEGGYARFRFDITDLVKPGRNVLAVRVDNARQAGVAPLSGDFTVFGGLYRDVRLVTTGDLHIDMLDFGGPGVYVATPEVTTDRAEVRWTVRVSNDRGAAAEVTINAQIGGAEAHKTITVAAHSTAVAMLEADLAHPHLWQGAADPYLYRSEVTVVAGGKTVDDMTVPVGLRDIRIDPDRGVLLNGRPYDVHGVNLHLAMRPGK